MSPPYSKRLKRPVDRLTPELEAPPPRKRRKSAARPKVQKVPVAPKRKSTTPKRSPQKRSNGTPVPKRSTPNRSNGTSTPKRSIGTPVPVRSSPYPCLANTPPIKPKFPVQTALPALAQPGQSSINKNDGTPAKKAKLTAQVDPPKPKNVPPQIKKPIPIAPKPKNVPTPIRKPIPIAPRPLPKLTTPIRAIPKKRPAKKVLTARTSKASVARKSPEPIRLDSDSEDSDIQVVDTVNVPPQHMLEPQRTYAVRFLQPKVASRPVHPKPVPRPPRVFPGILHRVIPSNGHGQPSGNGVCRPRRPLIEEPVMTMTASRQIPTQSMATTSVQSSIAANGLINGNRIPTPTKPIRPPPTPIPIQPRIEDESERSKSKTTSGSSVDGAVISRNRIPALPRPHPSLMLTPIRPRIDDESQHSRIRTTIGSSLSGLNDVINGRSVPMPLQSRPRQIPTPNRPVAHEPERNGITKGARGHDAVINRNRIPTPPRPHSPPVPISILKPSRPPPTPIPIQPHVVDESEQSKSKTTSGSSVNDTIISRNRIPTPPRPHPPPVPIPIQGEFERNNIRTANASSVTNVPSSYSVNAVVSGNRIPTPPRPQPPPTPTPNRSIADESDQNRTRTTIRSSVSGINDVASSFKIPTPPRPQPPSLPTQTCRIVDEWERNRTPNDASVPTPNRSIADDSERNRPMNACSAISGNMIPTPPQPHPTPIPTPIRHCIDDQSQGSSFRTLFEPIAYARNAVINDNRLLMPPIERKRPTNVHGDFFTYSRVPTVSRPHPMSIPLNVDDDYESRQTCDGITEKSADFDSFFNRHESKEQEMIDRRVPGVEPPPKVPVKPGPNEEPTPEAYGHPPNYFLCFEFDHEFDWAFEEWPHLRPWTHL